MQHLEPFFRWHDDYQAAKDRRSPFYGRTHSEFYYTHTVYDHYIHPQWDDFGAETLYLKVLYADYHAQCAIIELIGEWNDLLHNDISQLRQEIIDPMLRHGICKFVLLCDYVMNFHASDDDDYYAEWQEAVYELDGWIALLDLRPHVIEEMHRGRLHQHTHFGPLYNQLRWRLMRPHTVVEAVEALVQRPPIGLLR